jgi:hypothetical protein
MKTPATEIEIAEKLAKEIRSASPDDILAGVLQINGSDLNRHKVDAIRICILVKKILSTRYRNLIPGSGNWIPGSDRIKSKATK